MLKLDWGDAQVWMDIATTLYMRNAPNPEMLPRRTTAYPRANELNVAAVCTGYAFEFIFKVLVKAGGGQPEGVHKPSEAYRKLVELAPGECDEIGRIATDHGWSDANELLAYLDEHLCDPNRKYWMQPRPPKDGPARGVFHFGGRRGIDALERLHKALSALALKRINERPDGSEEVWPGTDLP